MVKEALKKVGKAVKETVDGIGQNAGAFVEDLKKVPVLGAVAETVDGIIQDPKAFAEDVKKAPVLGAVAETVDGIVQDPKAFAEDVKKAPAVRSVAETVDGIGQNAGAFVEDLKKVPVLGAVAETVDGIIQDPKAFAEDVKKAPVLGAVAETVDGIVQDPKAFAEDVKKAPAVRSVAETVDGIIQDPKAFGRDVDRTVSGMVKEATAPMVDAANTTKRVVDKYVVQPVKEEVATLRETVQGVAQDPAAFGRDVARTVSGMVEKAAVPVGNAAGKAIASVKGVLGKAAQKTGEQYDQIQAVLVRFGRDVKGFTELPKDQQQMIAEGFLKDLQKAGKDGIDASKGFIAGKVAGIKGALRRAAQPVQKATQKVSNAVEVTMRGLERDIDGFKNLTPEQKRQIAETFVREAGENAVKLWDKAKNYALVGAVKIAGKGK